MEIGTRVKVAIPDRRLTEWNTPTAQTLQGTVGVVEKIKPPTAWGRSRGDLGNCLVTFDAPVVLHGIACESFHFDVTELDELGA